VGLSAFAQRQTAWSDFCLENDLLSVVLLAILTCWLLPKDVQSRDAATGDGDAARDAATRIVPAWHATTTGYFDPSFMLGFTRF